MNINGDTTDPFYRYKMPGITVKHIGKSTIISNIDEVLQALNRTTGNLLPYLSRKLACRVRMDKEKGMVIPGVYRAEDLRLTLDQYIKKYVLCGICRNPETDIDGGIMTCRACGARQRFT